MCVCVWCLCLVPGGFVLNVSPVCFGVCDVCVVCENFVIFCFDISFMCLCVCLWCL